MERCALITGITGQDGSYLAELLLSKGYEVHGIVRRSSSINTHRIDHLYEDPHVPNARLHLHYGDLSSAQRLSALVSEIQPDEVYNLGAQSHVMVSFDMPEYTAEISGLGALRLLDALRAHAPEARFYNAATSEMFGESPPPQSESTEYAPVSPYAAAKVFATTMTSIYRNGYNLHASSGILFNHESPRRGETFVSRKITRAIAAILAGRQDTLYLGNLDSRRDWGYAPEYVEAMWLMLQQSTPGDYVIGTGESHTVREFVEAAFSYAGLESEKHVVLDDRYLRPLEIEHLRSDPTLAAEKLGWSARTTFDDLVKIMIDADMEALGLESPGEGKKLVENGAGNWQSWRPAQR